MIFKITGFTKFPDGQDKDCIAVTENGKKIIVDPFVGCAFEYENREALVGTWFAVKSENWSTHPEITGEVLLPSEGDFRIVDNKKYVQNS